MMRPQAAPPTSGLSALAAHSPRSAGVAASAGIASRRPTQRSSPPDPRAAMLFPLRLALRCDTTGGMTLAPTADILPSSTQVRAGSNASFRQCAGHLLSAARRGAEFALVGDIIDWI